MAQFRSRFEMDGATGLLSQKALADKVECTRTDVAYLEEGRSLPTPEKLKSICLYLQMPESLWLAATHPYFKTAVEFQELLGEMLGKSLTLENLEGSAAHYSIDAIQRLFVNRLTASQCFDQFNSILTFFGERPITQAFFNSYIRETAFNSNENFEKAVREFQRDAMRLYGNFRRAWTTLSRKHDLGTVEAKLGKVNLSTFENRIPFDTIDVIEPERLPDLGYIAVQRIRKETQERHELKDLLNGMATQLEETKALSPTITAKQHARLRSLLRQFESGLQAQLEILGGLFDSVTPEELRNEAKHVAPVEQELAQITETQKRGLRNLAVYLSEPFMDVYVATSMRDDADFISVNAFVERLFNSPELKPLNLRYFNPTQSWIGDRVAKGLVEALMLRRASVTVYMAQKGDTFGKDSEASVALGQGKSVIVYVPCLYDEQGRIDSALTYALPKQELLLELAERKLDAGEKLDSRELASLILRDKIEKLSPQQFSNFVLAHWADFDLLGDINSVKDEHVRRACTSFVTGISARNLNAAATIIEIVVRATLTDLLVSSSAKFESRATTFRDIHPLSLQVIVESGVLNGIMVC